MRTDDEIVERIKERMPEDVLGFEVSDLVRRLPFDRAKEFLIPEASAEGWNQLSRDRESVVREMREYMPFAWSKANGFRGLSAARSMLHYMAWIWLAGDDEAFGDLTEYEYYGKDHLAKICEVYGFESLDNGVRLNSEPEN